VYATEMRLDFGGNEGGKKNRQGAEEVVGELGGIIDDDTFSTAEDREEKRKKDQAASPRGAREPDRGTPLSEPLKGTLQVGGKKVQRSLCNRERGDQLHSD